MSAPVVVIGAGMGGLAAALDLSAGGLDVVLCERADRPGGKLRQACIDGQAIDCGPTVFTMRWVFDALFRDAGIDFCEILDLERPDLLARHSWPDGSRLDLFADIDKSCTAIEAFAGKRDSEAYRRFAADSAEVFDTLDASFMQRDKPSPSGLVASLGMAGLPRLWRTRPWTSLWRELGARFHDPRLRQLFARYATYCGSSPLEAPATLMLIAHAERAGVWLIDGGMQRLADALADAATRTGAELRFGTGVARVERLRDQYRVETDSGESLEASAVVFNGDVAALGSGELGDDPADALPRRAGETRSLSAITWCLRARVDDFPLAHHSVFFGGDYPTEFRAIFERGTVTTEPTVYVCAQDRGMDDGHSGDGPERLFVLINAPPMKMDNDALGRAEQAAFALLDRQGLALSADNPGVVRSTPADFDARFPGSDGAIYGWPTHGWYGTFRRAGAETALPGFFCAGGTVHPGPGIPMATLSGRIAARRVREYLAS